MEEEPINKTKNIQGIEPSLIQEPILYCLDDESKKNEQEEEYVLFQKWDKQVGVFILYEESIIQKLLKCYPIWAEMPQREEISLMVNGGCIYYKYKLDPFVFGLDLRTEQDKIRDLTTEDWNKYIKWFARFADLVVRGNYKQEWYINIFLQLKLTPERQYVKSFFSILANLAFNIQQQEENEIKLKLTDIFKQILEFEANRNYQKEIEETKKVIDELIKQQENEQPLQT